MVKKENSITPNYDELLNDITEVESKTQEKRNKLNEEIATLQNTIYICDEASRQAKIVLKRLQQNNNRATGITEAKKRVDGKWEITLIFAHVRKLAIEMMGG